MDDEIFDPVEWAAEGIREAEAAGGITLDMKQRTGFVRGKVVYQRPNVNAEVSGQLPMIEWETDDE